MKTIALITAALVLSGSILSAAKAAPPSDVATAVVKFGDLDTTRPAGKEELYRRFARAARSTCRSLDPSDASTKWLASRAQYEACINQALEGAVARFNRPDFTEYVAARTGKSTSAGVRLADR
jgi:UrcA family protein